jgi:NADH dehydrogenase/NADH:ubiquinone oxidoreductase subunit G
MPNPINLLIDDTAVQVEEGTTIMKAAKLVGIDIPTICFHDFCTSNALCRICVVDVEGSRTLVASCVAKVAEGMKVRTQTGQVRLARRSILEMLASTVDLSEAPDILGYIQEYGADVQRFPQAERREPLLIDDNPMYIRDYAKCILCWRCVQVCAADAQYTYAINFSSRGYKTSISTFYNRPMPETTCVFCGQCVGVCPTGALKPKREWLLENGISESQIGQLTRSERKSKRQRHEGGVE